MTLPDSRTRKHIVLLGAGHSHVAVLKAFGERPHPGVALTLVTRDVATPYSGMLPGFVSGQYDHADLHIDAGGLARFAGAALVTGEATGIDTAAQTLSVTDRSPLSYDLLSIDIGSAPSRPADMPGIPVKPIGRFVERLEQMSADLPAGPGPVRIAIVGTGPAGVELALALQRRLSGAVRQVGGDATPDVAIALLGRAKTILPERSGRTQRRIAATLARRGITVRTGFDVTGFANGQVRAADGRTIAADTLLWATSSAAAPWLRETGLALDPQGFVRVDATLRSISHPEIFAAGDIAALPDPRPKAGVFAVREGPVLAQNLRRAIAGEPLRSYRPQRHWLTLLSTADGRAVADKWGLSLEGRWVWRWKDWNDRRFVDGYNALAASAAADRQDAAAR
ncbi:FAD-dependent oxidoreductase [Aurantimonas sp. A2-1-M11]|uniref:FAD-dependent oxidoreductase n=1 Tax=Aurantimonas sp. A2-1-M11 TaxID=3113712 RepID=UPI002F95B5F8